METIKPELFSRQFYTDLKQKWISYLEEEVHVQPHYFLFYALVKEKNAFKVFSPITNQSKLDLADEGPWEALKGAIANLQSNLKTGNGVFTLIGSQKNRQYDREERKWTFNQTNHDIHLTNEQIEVLQTKLQEALEKTANPEVYAHFHELAEKTKAVQRAKRLASPYRRQAV